MKILALRRHQVVWGSLGPLCIYFIYLNIYIYNYIILYIISFLLLFLFLFIFFSFGFLLSPFKRQINIENAAMENPSVDVAPWGIVSIKYVLTNT